MTDGSFKGSAIDRPINSDAIVKLYTHFPDINLEWLITGQVKTPTNAVHESSNTPDFKAKYLDVVENYMILNNENSELRQELKTLKKQLLIKNE
ncbi:hypothetical protein [Formosa sp. Hel1_33_131]|uniref:hypothetical protein n=1 Tax=Formosa sp. Hel1_33_131 TaxID=1336794 RepID=UPI0012FCD18F|nr:hypothetical protein [Formosa sp. Hel1_33_131]